MGHDGGSLRLAFWTLAIVPVIAYAVDEIVFITGDLASQETWEFLQASGRPYLSKPFPIDGAGAFLDGGGAAGIRCLMKCPIPVMAEGGRERPPFLCPQRPAIWQ